MFLVLVPRSDGAYDAFIPARENESGVRVPVHVPGAGQLDARVEYAIKEGDAIGLCLGAALGIVAPERRKAAIDGIRHALNELADK